MVAMAVSAWTTADPAPDGGEPGRVRCVLRALVIAGAIAINQRLEFRGDAKMPAHGRPPITGRMS